jgi:hypothetical protein
MGKDAEQGGGNGKGVQNAAGTHSTAQTRFVNEYILMSVSNNIADACCRLSMPIAC